MKLSFSGRCALILGGSCDLAIALAEVMIPLGLHPTLTYRNDAGKQRIKDGLSQYTGEYDLLMLDMAKSDMAGQIGQCLEQGLDYLVDFAQGDLEGLVASVDSEKVKEYFNANISARSEVIQLAARKMLVNKKGRMVHVSSAAAGRPNSGQGFYAAAKQAAEALYRSVGLELACRGITTVSLRPGYVDADRGRHYLESRQKDVLKTVPTGRALSVREVVDTILFLLSDSALGFNATVLTIDGGLSGKKTEH